MSNPNDNTLPDIAEFLKLSRRVMMEMDLLQGLELSYEQRRITTLAVREIKEKATEFSKTEALGG